MKTRVSRRSLLTGMAAAGAASLLTERGAAAQAKGTAFALIGDRWHNSDYIRAALSKTLGSDLNLSIDFNDNVKLLSAETLRGYKMLILFRDGMEWSGGYYQKELTNYYSPIMSVPPAPELTPKPIYWMNAEQGRAVKEFVQNGGGLLCYHNVPYISSHNEDFRDVLGAVTQEHPPFRPFRVKITNHDHPITHGVSDFLVTDEQHFNDYQKDPKHILMQSVNEDGLTFKNLGNTATAGWAYDYGKGRVCYLAVGHVITALWNPEYEKLQRNAARWLLREI